MQQQRQQQQRQLRHRLHDANDAKVSKLLHQVNEACKISESDSELESAGESPSPSLSFPLCEFFERIFGVLIKIVENLRNGFDKAPQ